MSSSEATRTLTLSVLDRLIDADPKNKSESTLTSAQTLRQMKFGLRRDLERLMNTRKAVEEVPESCIEVLRSVHNYGLTDIASVSTLSTADRNILLKAIEEAIVYFEPRLARVRVSLQPVADSKLHFVIEGLLRIDPVPERIVFDTVLELSSGAYQIRGDAGA